MSKQKRFSPLKNHQGIRKDSLTEKYVARKRVRGKQYCETFAKVSDAIHWRKYFHPLLTNAEIKGISREYHTKIQSKLNGIDGRFTLGEVWELYKTQHLPEQEELTVETYKKFARLFLPELMGFKMQEISAEVLDAFMKFKVEAAKKSGNPRRHSFKGDLKFLKALLNWYRENYDSTFVNPILKRHFTLGTIKKVPKRKVEKMTIEHIRLFLNSFDNPFWSDLAELHFYMAGRIQDVGGLQWKSVDVENDLIKVDDVAIWNYNTKKFSKLKEIPKNKEQRVVRLNQQMIEILKRRWDNRSKTPCQFFRESTGERLSFVFEIDGQPVTYRQVQYSYNKALKKAGLFPRFSSTHILRKAMANTTRKELGLDAAQVSGGWKTRSIVEQIYTDAPTDLSKKIVTHVGNLLANSNPKKGGTGSKQNRLKLVRDA